MGASEEAIFILNENKTHKHNIFFPQIGLIAKRILHNYQD